MLPGKILAGMYPLLPADPEIQRRNCRHVGEEGEGLSKRTHHAAHAERLRRRSGGKHEVGFLDQFPGRNRLQSLALRPAIASAVLRFRGYRCRDTRQRRCRVAGAAGSLAVSRIELSQGSPPESAGLRGCGRGADGDAVPAVGGPGFPAARGGRGPGERRECAVRRRPALRIAAASQDR